MSGWLQGENATPMQKYNHEHDPKTGEFGSSGGSAGKTWSGAPENGILPAIRDSA